MRAVACECGDKSRAAACFKAERSESLRGHIGVRRASPPHVLHPTRSHPMNTRASEASGSSPAGNSSDGSPEIEDLVRKLKRSRKTSVQVKDTPGEPSDVKKAKKAADLEQISRGDWPARIWRASVIQEEESHDTIKLREQLLLAE